MNLTVSSRASRTLLSAVAALAVSASLTAAPASAHKNHGYSYGPKGSCMTKVNGKRERGYAEYFNHKRTRGSDGKPRCVLQ